MQFNDKPIHLFSCKPELDVYLSEIRYNYDANLCLGTSRNVSIPPLMVAVKLNKLDMVQKCIDRGDDVNLDHYNLGTPLLLASENNHQDVIDMLIDNQADWRAETMRGRRLTEEPQGARQNLLRAQLAVENIAHATDMIPLIVSFLPAT